MQMLLMINKKKIRISSGASTRLFQESSGCL